MTNITTDRETTNQASDEQQTKTITPNKKIKSYCYVHFKKLSMRYSKLLVMRIDLHYNIDQGNKISSDQAFHDVTTFCKNVMEEVKHIVGYVWVMEMSDTGNIDFHAVFYANGQFKQKYFPLYEDIDKLWKEQVGDCSYTYDCNKNKKGYKFVILQTIKHNDTDAHNKIKYLFRYLSKEEQKEWIIDEHRYGQSHVSKPSGRGRPRKTDTAETSSQTPSSNITS